MRRRKGGGSEGSRSEKKKKKAIWQGVAFALKEGNIRSEKRAKEKRGRKNLFHKK